MMKFQYLKDPYYSEDIVKILMYMEEKVKCM